MPDYASYYPDGDGAGPYSYVARVRNFMDRVGQDLELIDWDQRHAADALLGFGDANEFTAHYDSTEGDMVLECAAGVRLALTGDLHVAGKKSQALTLNADAGDEYAFDLEYTVNKATSGNDYGLRLNKTDTLSPGTGYLAWLGVGESAKFYVTDEGYVKVAGTLDNSYIGSGAGVIIAPWGAGTGVSLKGTSTGSVTLSAINIVATANVYPDLLYNGSWRFTVNDQGPLGRITTTSPVGTVNGTFGFHIDASNNLIATVRTGDASYTYTIAPS